MLVNQGLVGPKPRPKGVGDGYVVNIRQLPIFRLSYGVTKEEIAEVITHMAFYGGWPTAANAVQVAKEVFDERG